MPFIITPGDLDDPRVLALLAEHFAGMAAHSPPQSIHALDLSGLRRPDITFWTIWNDDPVPARRELLGCGALRELDPHHGEIKSMRTAAAHLRRGVGSMILQHIIAEARRRGYRRLSLETGSGPAFAAAHALYTRFNFTPCGPFADYPTDDPFSRFMTLEVNEGNEISSTASRDSMADGSVTGG